MSYHTQIFIHFSLCIFHSLQKEEADHDGAEALFELAQAALHDSSALPADRDQQSPNSQFGSGPPLPKKEPRPQPSHPQHPRQPQSPPQPLPQHHEQRLASQKRSMIELREDDETDIEDIPDDGALDDDDGRSGRMVKRRKTPARAGAVPSNAYARAGVDAGRLPHSANYSQEQQLRSSGDMRLNDDEFAAVAAGSVSSKGRHRRAAQSHMFVPHEGEREHSRSVANQRESDIDSTPQPRPSPAAKQAHTERTSLGQQPQASGFSQELLQESLKHAKPHVAAQLQKQQQQSAFSTGDRALQMLQMLQPSPYSAQTLGVSQASRYMPDYGRESLFQPQNQLNVQQQQSQQEQQQQQQQEQQQMQGILPQEYVAAFKQYYYPQSHVNHYQQPQQTQRRFRYCASHVYIAHFINYQQHMSRNVFLQQPFGSALNGSAEMAATHPALNEEGSATKRASARREGTNGVQDVQHEQQLPHHETNPDASIELHAQRRQAHKPEDAYASTSGPVNRSTPQRSEQSKKQQRELEAKRLELLRAQRQSHDDARNQHGLEQADREPHNAHAKFAQLSPEQAQQLAFAGLPVSQGVDQETMAAMLGRMSTQEYEGLRTIATTQQREHINLGRITAVNVGDPSWHGDRLAAPLRGHGNNVLPQQSQCDDQCTQAERLNAHFDNYQKEGSPEDELSKEYQQATAEDQSGNEDFQLRPHKRAQVTANEYLEQNAKLEQASAEVSSQAHHPLQGDEQHVRQERLGEQRESHRQRVHARTSQFSEPEHHAVSAAESHEMEREKPPREKPLHDLQPYQQPQRNRGEGAPKRGQHEQQVQALAATAVCAEQQQQRQREQHQVAR